MAGERSFLPTRTAQFSIDAHASSVAISSMLDRRTQTTEGLHLYWPTDFVASFVATDDWDRRAQNCVTTNLVLSTNLRKPRVKDRLVRVFTSLKSLPECWRALFSIIAFREVRCVPVWRQGQKCLEPCRRPGIFHGGRLCYCWLSFRMDVCEFARLWVGINRNCLANGYRWIAGCGPEPGTGRSMAGEVARVPLPGCWGPPGDRQPVVESQNRCMDFELQVGRNSRSACSDPEGLFYCCYTHLGQIFLKRFIGL